MKKDQQLTDKLKKFAREENQKFREEIQRIEKQKQREINAAKRHLTGVIDTLRAVADVPDDYEFYCDDDGVGFRPPEDDE